jgi:putative ABC transport system permease protein
VDKGFTTPSAVSLNVELYSRYNQLEKQNAFYRSLLERTGAIGGVQDAALIDHMPLGGGESISLLEVEGHPFDAQTSFESRSVTPRYFAAMGIPLLEGRVFEDGDSAGRAGVILVSRSFARRYFPGQSALGRKVHTSGVRTIVGVVADVRQRELDATPPMQVYLPLWQTGSGSVSLVVRSTMAPEGVAAAVRSVMRELDPRLAVGEVRTVDELVSRANAVRRFQTFVLSGFGGVALVLALIGLYGLMAWSVQQRTAEIGIRMALGAQKASVMGLVLRQGARLWAAGIGLGFAGACGVTRWMRGLLFEVEPSDPVTFVAVAVVFCVVAVTACYVPARRAARVDPAISLRHE